MLYGVKAQKHNILYIRLYIGQNTLMERLMRPELVLCVCAIYASNFFVASGLRAWLRVIEVAKTFLLSFEYVVSVQTNNHGTGGIVYNHTR